MTSTTLFKGHKECDRKQVLCDRVTRIAEQGSEAVSVRLEELEQEWPTGRLVKATTGVSLYVALALTAFVSPWWLILIAGSGGVLLQYWFFRRSWLADLFAWCGYRSGSQIEEERIVLRVLRGDFRNLPTIEQIEDRDAMMRLEGEGGIAFDSDEERYDPKSATNLILQKTH